MSAILSPVISTPTGFVPDDEELVRRAAAMIPVLRQRAAACDALGQVPDETIQMFADAGFFRILQPAAYGGYEKSPLTFYRVLQEVASGCPCSGWVLMVLGVHNWEAALLDPRAAEDLWGQDDNVRISSAYAPMGKARKVDGGYHVAGRWGFSSGCNHATWVFLGAIVEGDGDYRVFLIPRPDYRIIEGSWDVFGLQGTGSKDVEVAGCFVPEYRSHSLARHFSEPGHDIGLKTFTNPNYKVPFGAAFGNGVASVIAGMGKGMLEVYCEQMQARKDNIFKQQLSNNSLVQRRIHLADSKVRSARALIRDVAESALGFIARNEPVPMALRARYVADAATVGELISEASVLLFRASGGKAISNSNPLQRYFRHIQAGCNHICMDLDKLGVNAGGTLVGLENRQIVS